MATKGAAKNSIDHGVPADSGGTDGSSYTIDTVRKCAWYLLEAANAGDESDACASCPDCECNCALSGSK